MSAKLKLYVWEDVLTDWTSGMIVILASSDDEVIIKLREMFGNYKTSDKLKYEDKDPEIIDLENVQEPMSWFVYGGG